MLPTGSFVLHLDIDSFFAQAEQLRDPSLQSKAVAVQQHQDIIAANHAAKAAGVTKHMAPAEARRLLSAVGGRVVHVHLAEGGRVSYQPYRELSSRMVKLLRALPWAAVVEKASIDECYILVTPKSYASSSTSEQATAAAMVAPRQGAAVGASSDRELAGSGGDDDGWCDEDEGEMVAAGFGPGLAASVSPQAALQLAQEAKAAVLAQVGLRVSVGAAPNRLIAKLASGAAKPDGVRLVPDQQAAVQLLSQTPARRLPGYGGKAADVFEQRGIGPATALQRYSQAQLEQMLGLKPAAAAQLHQWCRGLDDTPVQDKGPPKTLSVQMSLTPQLLAMHPSQRNTVSASGGPAGVLEPLVTGRPDFRLRIRQLMTAMGLDLLQRVQEDKAEEGRWPRTLTASMRGWGAGRDQSFTSRSGTFPALALAVQAQRQRQQGPSQLGTQQQQQREAQQQGRGQHGAASAAGARARAAGPAQLDALEEAMVSGLEQLVHQAAATYPPTATVVELRLAATNFELTSTAAAAGPISRFFTAAPKGGAAPQQRPLATQVQQQQQRQQRPEQASRQQQQRQAQPQSGAQAELAPSRCQQPAQHAQQDQSGTPAAVEGQRAGAPGHEAIPPANQQRQQQQQQQPGSSVLTAAASRPAGSKSVDLGAIDVSEQQRILREIEQQQRHGTQPAQQLVAGQTHKSGGDGGGKKRSGGKGPPAPVGKQQKTILGFLQR